MTTRANDSKPTKRVVCGRFGDFNVELGSSTITIWPKGSRAPKLRVTLVVGQVYQRGLDAALAQAKKEKKRCRR